MRILYVYFILCYCTRAEGWSFKPLHDDSDDDLLPIKDFSAYCFTYNIIIHKNTLTFVVRVRLVYIYLLVFVRVYGDGGGGRPRTNHKPTFHRSSTLLKTWFSVYPKLMLYFIRSSSLQLSVKTYRCFYFSFIGNITQNLVGIL